MDIFYKLFNFEIFNFALKFKFLKIIESVNLTQIPPDKSVCA